MTKQAVAKVFQVATVAGKKSSRGPADAIAPSTPTLRPVQVGATTIALAWVNGADAQTGISGTVVQRRLSNTVPWTDEVIVPYVAGAPSASAYTFTDGVANTSYDLRIANRDHAVPQNTSAFTAPQTVTTLASAVDLQPGTLAITVASIAVGEGQALSISVARTGAGALAPIVRVDWTLAGFGAATPVPATGPLEWAAGTNGIQSATVTVPSIVATITGTFDLSNARALSGNLNPTVGLASIPVTFVESTPGLVGVKWQPGHGMEFNSYLTPSSDGYTASQVSALAGEANVKFVLHRVYWASLESAQGQYNFSRLKTLLALCQASGVGLMIMLIDRTFGGDSAIGYLPLYLNSLPGGSGGYYQKSLSGGTGIVSREWLAPVQDRKIALYQAFAAADAGGGYTFDTHPWFWGVMTEESVPGGGVASGTPSDYTPAALAAQLKRGMTQGKAAWPHTHFFANLNFLSGQMEGLVAHAHAAGCGITGPDTVPLPAPPDPAFGTQAQRAFLGYHEDGSAGGISYVGKMAALWQVQGPELGGKEGTFSMASIGNFGALLGGNMMAWLRSTLPAPRPTWTGDILPYLRGSPAALATACPTNLPACVVPSTL